MRIQYNQGVVVIAGLKKTANVGDKIMVVRENHPGWGEIRYPLGSVWIVKEVLSPKTGLVVCDGNQYGIYSKDYIVIN
ncbi:hypothetical protein LIT25_21310 [Bacillus sp. F19]|nr:hypothetical protein LIT25_21310 [Bacillus sp. F19]